MSSSQSAIPVLQPANDLRDTLPPSSKIVRRNDARETSAPTLASVTTLPCARLPHFAPEEPKPQVTSSAQSTISRDCAAMQMVEHLVERGVDTFFGIPGGPICPFFEAIRLHPQAVLIESRHESHAAFAAAAYFRATGQLAAVVVTAGPGVTNAVTGIASAYSEAVPMLVVAGDVAWSSHGGRLAQNSGPEGLNIEQMLAPVTCCQIRVTNARSAVGQTFAALDAATDPLRPGPALLVLPIDRATEVAPRVEVPRPRRQSTVAASQESVRTVARWLAEAKRPLIVLGAGCLRHADWVRQLVDVLDVPFVTTPRAKGVVSEEHPRSLRNGGMAASMWARHYTAEPVDVALVLGTDLDDSSVGPTPYVGAGGRLIHVDIDPRVFNRNLPTHLGITADLGHFCNDLYQMIVSEGYLNGRGRALVADVRSRSAYDIADFRGDNAAVIRPHRAVSDLQLAMPTDTRFVTDIGEHMLFALHYLTARGPQDFHIQLNLGSMGSGIAGASGLAIADPMRPVVCICGDGGMQMSGMEILTSVKHKLPIVYAVFNDSRYNMVHHGMKKIFGESDAYDTTTVDFSLWALSMGVVSQTITRPGQITRELMDRLMLSGGPVLLDIRIDKEVSLRGGGRVEALQHMSMLASGASPQGTA